MLPQLLVSFYRFWHGKLHLKGAGLFLKIAARFLPGFDTYELAVPTIGALTINLKDSSGIAWLNYSLGETGLEVGMISAIAKLATKTSVIWDIGANAGFFIAALIDQLKDYAEIRLFEPNPRLTSILHQLAGLLPNVHSHNLAFSDQAGIAVLYVPKRESSTASFNANPNFAPVEVECTTGDLFLNQSGASDPDLVIIDTEGNDCRVINGFAELIRRKRPTIFFENIFETEESIRASLPERYQHFTVDDESGALIPGLDKSRGHNSVFVTQI